MPTGSPNVQGGLHRGNERRGENGIYQRVDAVPLGPCSGEVTGGVSSLDSHYFAWHQIGGTLHDSGCALREGSQDQAVRPDNGDAVLTVLVDELGGLFQVAAGVLDVADGIHFAGQLSHSAGIEVDPGCRRVVVQHYGTFNRFGHGAEVPVVSAMESGS